MLREFISFHQFKGLSTPELLHSVLFSAADFLSVLLLVKFVRNVPIPLSLDGTNAENHTFSPALSSITELDQSVSISDDFRDDVDTHLLQQDELELEEQNAQDVASFNDWTTGSGYNGLFWDEINS